jgi:endoglucanase
MNEPHDIPNMSAWAATQQAAVNAIRKAGATSQTILLSGTGYTHAPDFYQGTDNALLVSLPSGQSSYSTLSVIVKVSLLLDQCDEVKVANVG